MFETLARVMLSPGDRLKMRCAACGHRAEWSRAQAFAAFGADASPFVVRRALVCGACGETRHLEVTI
jgi:hypothetical protein